MTQSYFILPLLREKFRQSYFVYAATGPSPEALMEKFLPKPLSIDWQNELKVAAKPT